MSKEQTACYDSCPIDHNCFGGYIEYDPECNTEHERIKSELSNDPRHTNVSLVPSADGVKISYYNNDEYSFIMIDQGLITTQD
jgi:hypothetical protein